MANLQKADQTNEVVYDMVYPDGSHVTAAITKQTDPLKFIVQAEFPAGTENYATWADYCSSTESSSVVELVGTLPVPGGGGTSDVEYYAPLLTELVTLTNASSGETELSNQLSRRRLDLRNAVNFTPQVIVGVIPFASTGKYVVQYSVNGGSSWADFYDFGTGYTANQLKIGTITAVPAAAQVIDCLLRVVHRGGNGTADPTIRHCGLMIHPP